jgi:hypothetical protein
VTAARRAERLAAELRASVPGAGPVEARPTRRGHEVVASLPGPEVNRAQRVAAGHGFTLHGKTPDGRYRFETESGPGERPGRT